MQEDTYVRKSKEDKPVVAICYDFDKTLTPTDMQAQGFIQSLGYDVEEFWKESNSLAINNDMDQNLAYMYTMKEESEGKTLFTKKKLIEYGEKIEFFPGVEEWFDRIKEYGKEKGVIIEHYIISSGLQEMIEGTSIFKSGAFERVYANSFYYNERNVAVWPAQIINYTNKTQFLFRIEKGVLDINDPDVNKHFEDSELRVPFQNIVYIGDSATDVPCMKLVNTYGGHSIGVYNLDKGDKTQVYDMMREGRIKYFAAADYREHSELDRLLKAIIDQTASNEKLKKIACDNHKDQMLYDENNSVETRKRRALIVELENSDSFATTHSIIKNARKVVDWQPDEINLLMDIAYNNSQVRLILEDSDVDEFYSELLKKLKTNTESADWVKNKLDNADEYR